MRLSDLHELIAAVCPIDGVNSLGQIFFSSTATAVQKTNAQKVLTANIGNLDPADSQQVPQ